MTTFELFFFWYCFFFWQSNHDFLLSSGFLSRATSEIFSQVAGCCGEEGELASFAAWNVISSTLWDHSEQLHFTFIFYLDQFSIIHKYCANVIMKKRTQLQKKLSAIIYCGISIGLVKWNYFDLIEQILHDVCEKKLYKHSETTKVELYFIFSQCRMDSVIFNFDALSHEEVIPLIITNVGYTSSRLCIWYSSSFHFWFIWWFSPIDLK